MRNLKYFVTSVMLVVAILLVGCGSGNVRVNLDLSEMSSYSVQSEVMKMQKSSTAQSYIGKNIKLRVKAYASGDYHYVIGPDGDECCNWEIEIKLSDELDSYPKTGKNAYVTGEYNYYKENGRTYYYLELLDFDYA